MTTATPKLDVLTRNAIRAEVRQVDGRDILWLDPVWLVTEQIEWHVSQNRDAILREIRSISKDGQSPDYCLMWCSTELESFIEDDPRFGYECDPTPVFRLLDAEFYAWLRWRMTMLQELYNTRRLDARQWDHARNAFNAIHAFAIEHIGEERLTLAAKNTQAVKGYQPPSRSTYAAYRETWTNAWETWTATRAAEAIAKQQLALFDPFEGE